MCKNFNTLPKAGGLLDQDSLFVYLSYHVSMFEQQKQELEDNKARINTEKRM